MSNLKTTDTQSLASQLPVELLVKILLFNKGTPVTPRTDLTVLSDVIYTQNASQVCRSWRNTAIACPFLWNSVIDFDRDHPAWIRLLLERCGNVPLVAKIAEPTSLSPPNPEIFSRWATVFEHLNRIRKLDVAFFNRAVTQPITTFIFDNLNHPAVVLEKLCLTALCLEVGDSSSIAAIFPPSIFTGTAPRLRRIELNNITLGLTLPYDIFRNLVSLSVSFEPFLRLPATPTSQWLQILSAMPLLEKLKIQEVKPAILRLGHSPPQHIRLDHLVQFTLHKDLGDCVDLLQNITFPLTCSFTIKCADTRPGNDYYAIHSILLHRLSSITGEAPTTTFSMGASFSYLSFGSGPNSNLRFRVDFYSAEGSYLALAEFDPPFISLLALFSQASSLYLEFNVSSPQFFITVLRLFKMATAVHTEHSIGYFNSLCLSANETAPHSESSQAVEVSRMHAYIDINAPIDILLPALVHISSGSRQTDDWACIQLWQFLKRRKELGCPLKSLETYHNAKMLSRGLRKLGLGLVVRQKMLPPPPQ